MRCLITQTLTDLFQKTALDYAEPAQRALLVEGIRPVLPLIRNTPYGKRIQNKLQREQVDSYGGGYHGAMRAQGLNPQLAHQSALHHTPHLEHYGSQNGLYAQNGAGLHAQGLHSLQGHSIDSYVLQGHHSPGLTPPHSHSAGFTGASTFANHSAFPLTGVNGGLNDHYSQPAAFGYSM